MLLLRVHWHRPPSIRRSIPIEGAVIRRDADTRKELPIENVVVLHGDTAVVQYGIGTFGSRATAVGGAALWYALQEIKTKMNRYGAMLLDSFLDKSRQ